MARAIRQRIALDIQVQKWLEAKGINLNMVRDNYTLTREFGTTELTITLFAGDFPLSEDKEGEELPLFVSNVTNRKHPTCIDVTTASERPYSSWVCGPECPVVICNDNACPDRGDHPAIDHETPSV